MAGKRAGDHAEVEELTQQLKSLKKQLTAAELSLAEAEKARQSQQQIAKAAQQGLDQAERHVLPTPINCRRLVSQLVANGQSHQDVCSSSRGSMAGQSRHFHTWCRKASKAQLDRASRVKAWQAVQGRLVASRASLQDVDQALENLGVRKRHAPSC